MTGPLHPGRLFGVDPAGEPFVEAELPFTAPGPMGPGTEYLEQAEAREAEEKLRGHACPNCGRVDWLAEYRAGDYVVLRCDDCMGSSARVRLVKAGQ